MHCLEEEMFYLQNIELCLRCDPDISCLRINLIPSAGKWGIQREQDFGRITFWETSCCVISDFRSNVFDVPLFWAIAHRRLVVVTGFLGRPISPIFKHQGVTKRVLPTTLEGRKPQTSTWKNKKEIRSKQITIEHNFITYSYSYISNIAVTKVHL